MLLKGRCLVITGQKKPLWKGLFKSIQHLNLNVLSESKLNSFINHNSYHLKNLVPLNIRLNAEKILVSEFLLDAD